MIIGVNGALGAGKDTVGAYLVSNYGFTRIGFADLLKKSAAACFGIHPSVWEDIKNDIDVYVEILDYSNQDSGPREIASISARSFLQKYGTEAHRDVFGYDFWVEAALSKCDPDGKYVITDCRFENEAIAIKQARGYIVKVTRPGTGGDLHVSEKPLPDALIDSFINNSGSIEHLHRNIDSLMNVRFGFDQAPVEALSGHSR